MDSKIKSLLLGVSLCWRWSDDRLSQFQDWERGVLRSQILERLEIRTLNMEPETIRAFLANPEEVIDWLEAHPKATMRLDSWALSIESPDFDDVDFEQFECPIALNGAVEEFSKTRSGDNWSCWWHVC
jgi:hypothetical protein